MRRLTLLLAGLLVVGNISAAQADSHAEAAVKYRQAVMKAIGGHTDVRTGATAPWSWPGN